LKSSLLVLGTILFLASAFIPKVFSWRALLEKVLKKEKK
jgi:hypothetical protein